MVRIELDNGSHEKTGSTYLGTKVGLRAGFGASSSESVSYSLDEP